FLVFYFLSLLCFFLTDPASTVIYTLSLHDALPISLDLIVYTSPEILLEVSAYEKCDDDYDGYVEFDLRDKESEILNGLDPSTHVDRKSTRLNSSHVKISYAVFCLKKKKKTTYKR